jgi:hypothetical protein
VVNKENTGMVFKKRLHALVHEPIKVLRRVLARQIEQRQYRKLLKELTGWNLIRKPTGVFFLLREIGGKGLSQECLAHLCWATNDNQLTIPKTFTGIIYSGYAGLHVDMRLTFIRLQFVVKF